MATYRQRAVYNGAPLNMTFNSAPATTGGFNFPADFQQEFNKILYLYLKKATEDAANYARVMMAATPKPISPTYSAAQPIEPVTLFPLNQSMDEELNRLFSNFRVSINEPEPKSKYLDTFIFFFFIKTSGFF